MSPLDGMTMEAAAVETAGTESADTAVESTATVDSGVETAESQDGADYSVDQEQADGADEAEAGEATAEGEQVDGDGRVIPQKYRDLFKNDKDLKAMFFADRAFKQEFPGGLGEVREYKEIFDTLGGKDGIESLAAERSQWEQLDNNLASGDPKALDSIIEQSPDGFLKLLPHALEKFHALDKEGYAHVMSRVLVNTLSSNGFTETLNMLKQHAANPENVRQLVEDAQEWFRGLQTTAQNVPVKKVDPERQKFDKDRADFESQKAAEFGRSVTKDVEAYQSKSVEDRAAKYLAPYKVELAKLKNAPQGSDDRDAYDALMREIDRELGTAIRSDANWVRQYKQVYGTRDQAKAVKMVTARLEKLINAPDKNIIKRVCGRFFRLSGAKTQESTQRQAMRDNAKDAGQGGTGATGKTGAPPKPHEVDWNRVPKGFRNVEDAIQAGKVFVKGKKELVEF
jgi:hypothetical protein